jgi:hypothetical protein
LLCETLKSAVTRQGGISFGGKMQYFAMTAKEKEKLENQGYQCKGGHTVIDANNKPTSELKWEFDLPEEKKEIVSEIIEKKEEVAKPHKIEPKKEQPKKRGNPNWLKRGKTK